MCLPTCNFFYFIRNYGHGSLSVLTAATVHSFLVALMESLRFSSISCWYATSPHEKSKQPTAKCQQLKKKQKLKRTRHACLEADTDGLNGVGHGTQAPPQSLHCQENITFHIYGGLNKQAVRFDDIHKTNLNENEEHSKYFTGLDGSRMETIRMGSSRSRLVEYILERA